METASMRHKCPRLLAGILCLSGLALLGAGRSAAANDGGPGTYLSPLVPLQRLDGENTHLHVDEVRIRPDGLLLQCSYTFGVIDARRAGAMRYLAQSLRHAIPGDERRPGCVHLAWDGDVVYTTHRGNIRNPAFLTAWDISKRESPVQLPVLQEPGVSYEGIDVANGNIFVAQHEKGLGIYQRGADHRLSRTAMLGGFSNAWGVRASGNDGIRRRWGRWPGHHRRHESGCAAGARPRRDRRTGARCGRRRKVCVRRRGLCGSRDRRRLGPGESHRRQQHARAGDRPSPRLFGRTRVRGGVERCARVRRVGSEESSIHRRGADDPGSRRRGGRSPGGHVARPRHRGERSGRLRGQLASDLFRTACSPSAWHRASAFPKLPGWSTSARSASARAGRFPFR